MSVPYKSPAGEETDPVASPLVAIEAQARIDGDAAERQFTINSVTSEGNRASVAEGATSTALATHAAGAALDASPHGLPALTGNGMVWMRVGGALVAHVPVKADVGLANVDNTSDAGKPVSAAQQAVLDAKQPLASTLTALALLSSTAFGRGLLEKVDAAAVLTSLGADAASATRIPTDASVTDAKVAAGAAIAEAKLALASDAAAATPSRRSLGAGATQAAQGSTTAPLASPALTGTPTAPTQAGADNTTAIATDAFVQTAVATRINKTIIDAKGDLIAGTANDISARVAAGTDGQVLIADAAQTAGLRWGALSQYDLDLMLPGINAPNLIYITATSSTAYTAGRVYYARFVVSRAFTAAVISFAVGTADTADNNVHVGILDGTLTRLVTSGAVASGRLNSTGVKTVSITPTVLSPLTVYYAAICVPTITTSLMLIMAAAGSVLAWLLLKSTIPHIGAGFQDSQAGIPANGALSIPASSNGAVLLGIRES